MSEAFGKFVICAECTNYQDCVDREGCRVEAEKAAEERRKLLAMPPDRGVTDVVARLTAFLHMGGVDLEKVQLVFLCDDLWEQGVVDATFKKSIRNMDLVSNLGDRVTGRPADFRDGVRFMGLRLRILTGEIRGS